jgi:hypothetical protein
LLVEQVFILDLDMKVLVLEILADGLDLLLVSEFPPVSAFRQRL